MAFRVLRLLSALVFAEVFNTFLNKNLEKATSDQTGRNGGAYAPPVPDTARFIHTKR